MKRKYLPPIIVVTIVGLNCLPGDIRPEPGHLYVTVEPSDATRNGFTTDDGWTIRIERLYATVGNSHFVGNECDVYGDAEYIRIFDMTAPGAQKLGELHALGNCGFQFNLSLGPGMYLGQGVTLEDRKILIDKSQLWYNFPAIAALYVKGRAEHLGVTKQFEWRIPGGVSVGDCRTADDDSPSTKFILQGGEILHPHVIFHAEDFFRVGVEPDAERHFGEFAAADANGDGDITLEEMDTIPSPIPLWSYEMYKDAGLPDGDVLLDYRSKLRGWPQFLQQRLLMQAFSVDGQRCRRGWFSSAEESTVFDVEF